MRRLFKCAWCGESFESDWSDAEANAEAEAVWGVEQASAREDMAVVCDPCWTRLVPPDAR